MFYAEKRTATVGKGFGMVGKGEGVIYESLGDVRLRS